MRPGRIPPVNNLITETPAVMPYIIIGMLGGMIGPMMPPEATRAPE